MQEGWDLALVLWKDIVVKYNDYSTKEKEKV